MSAVETLLAEVLAAHDRVATSCTLNGWAHRCTCGEVFSDEEIRLSAPLPPRVSEAHRAHVATEQAKALREWLTSDETVTQARARLGVSEHDWSLLADLIGADS